MSFAARSLYDTTGKRLYLTPNERLRFLDAAESQSGEWHTFAKFLVLTGCRISEALSVRPEHFDFEDNRVAIETLKQRRRGVWRRIPLPAAFLNELDEVHRLKLAPYSNNCLWPTGRTTAYERIKEIMAIAAITGPQACPKGLRHAFGVHALLSSVPVTTVQRWMGHARLETTQIYLSIGGEEEYELATRMWLSN